MLRTCLTVSNLAAAGVADGRDPAAELTEDDPREQQAKHSIEQVRWWTIPVLSFTGHPMKHYSRVWMTTCYMRSNVRGCLLGYRSEAKTSTTVSDLHPPGLLVHDSRDAMSGCVQEKANYKGAFSQLRTLKGEIEHLQLLLEQSRRKLQQNFQQWLGMVGRQQQQQPAASGQQAVPAGSSAPSSTAVSSSRPGSARQFARSTSESSRLMAHASKQLQGGELVRPPSSHNLRKAVSIGGNTGSLLQDAGQYPLPAAALSGAGSSSTHAAGLDLSKVDPKLLQAAGPHLTGNPEADMDIIRFYEAKEKLLQMKLGVRGGAT